MADPCLRSSSREHDLFIHLLVHIFIHLSTWYFFQGYGLKCKSCMVDGGWDECKNHAEVMTCPSGQDRCAKAKAEALVGSKTYTYYVKSCTFENECKEKNCSRIGQAIPNFKKIIKCNVACCKTDLCNDGTGISMVSGFTLFTCAVLALTRSAVSKDWCVGF